LGKKVKLFIGYSTRAGDVGNVLRNVDIVFHFAANLEVRLE
jgi:hypothetical protein